MTRVVDSRPVLDFVQDLFEEPHVMVNVTVLCYSHDRPQIRHLPRPTAPVKGGKRRIGRKGDWQRSWRRK